MAQKKDWISDTVGNAGFELSILKRFAIICERSELEIFFVFVKQFRHFAT